MPPPTQSRAQNVWTWTPDELILILLRQFKRLLADHGVDRADADLRELASRAAQHTSGEADAAVTAALREIIAESEALLGTLGLTFAQALATEMTDLPGWESTADFLNLANEKINAEMRISTGSALLLLLGDATYARHLLTAVAHGADDRDDVEAVIARRALGAASGLDPRASDALVRFTAWVDALPN